MKQYRLGLSDGHKIAFQAEMDGRWVIHLMNVDGTERRELINNSAWAAQPKWQHPSSKLTIDPLYLHNTPVGVRLKPNRHRHCWVTEVKVHLGTKKQ